MSGQVQQQHAATHSRPVDMASVSDRLMKDAVVVSGGGGGSRSTAPQAWSSATRPQLVLKL